MAFVQLRHSSKFAEWLFLQIIAEMTSNVQMFKNAYEPLT
jgi:hypothetical protein